MKGGIAVYRCDSCGEDTYPGECYYSEGSTVFCGYCVATKGGLAKLQRESEWADLVKRGWELVVTYPDDKALRLAVERMEQAKKPKGA